MALIPDLTPEMQEGHDEVGYRMRIGWDDLNRTDQPGEYHILNFIVVVTLSQIEIWEDHPDAYFELVPIAADGPQRYELGVPSWN